MTFEYTMFQMFIWELWILLLLVWAGAIRCAPEFVGKRPGLLIPYLLAVAVLYFWGAHKLLT